CASPHRTSAASSSAVSPRSCLRCEPRSDRLRFDVHEWPWVTSCRDDAKKATRTRNEKAGESGKGASAVKSAGSHHSASADRPIGRRDASSHWPGVLLVNVQVWSAEAR